MEERVVLVDENDAEVGTLEKQRAHQEGRLHRALSVFVLNSRGEMLLQRRAAGKYHSPGLWTNTCCSHPRARKRTRLNSSHANISYAFFCLRHKLALPNTPCLP